MAYDCSVVCIGMVIDDVVDVSLWLLLELISSACLLVLGSKKLAEMLENLII